MAYNPPGEAPLSPILERNPVTHARHRRETLWQITVPVMLGVGISLALVALVVFSALQPGQAVSVWADISLLWLILPVLFLSFIAMVLLGGIAYGIVKLIQVIPFQTRRLHDLLILLNRKISQFDNSLVEPVLKYHAFKASTGKLGKAASQTAHKSGKVNP